jgi:glutamate-ammonia-ligase adenylyltransferase
MTGNPQARAALLSQLASAENLSDADWLCLDFHDLPRVKQTVAALRAYGLTSGGDASLLACLTQSCDPEQALFTLLRWLEAGGGDMPDSGPGSSWQHAPFLTVLGRLFAATPALSDYFIRYPQRARPVLERVLSSGITGGRAWRKILGTRVLAGETHAARLAALRRLRVECMLQIAALDLAGQSPLRDTVRALSDLAAACVDIALEISIERLKPRFGTAPNPRPLAPESSYAPPPLVIFALGKLGGRELNYSSDIDLVFAHEASGETTGGSRPAEVEAYFTALAEEVTTTLDKVTENGRVYRVDLRLRPHGSAGQLVKGRRDLLNYFQTEGRTWERQAWLKALPVAGDIALGHELLDAIAPFVFQRYLSLDAIGDIQALKRQIEISVARRGETEDEVKLGRGGIRDIEFTVQFMQLLHGSEHPKVRGGNTLNALYDLRREGLLSDKETDPLAAAYVFLRNVEHRLQLYGDLQVHRLPSDQKTRRRIAQSLGYADQLAASGQPAQSAEDQFEADRARHTSRTRDVFQGLFANLFRESRGTEGRLSDLLLAPQPDIQQIAALLPAFGFASSDASARELLELSREKLIMTSPSRTRKFFASIAPQLLKALAATGEPDDALRRFSRIAGSLGAKSVFYQMLNENLWLLKMTAELSAWSEYLTDILVANPGLFDELVDALRTARSKSSREMRGELAQIAIGGDIADTLRAYRAGELLRIGVRDLLHDANLEQTQAELSDMAEAILRTQVEHSLKKQRARRGAIKGADGKEVEFAILALGKFGGREMNYGSDLDVIYFHGNDGQTGDGMPAVTFFAELAQDLTRTMATATGLGPLYDLDARLRPNGSKGPLSLSLDDFKRYWTEGQLADWERLALTRARVVAGDEALGERALHLIRSAVYSPLKDTSQLAEQVVSMRRKLEENAEPGDMKRGPGGIMDIEFLAQYLQLMHGPAYPPLRQANTEQSLRTLQKFKKLAPSDATALLASYDFLRKLENRVRIVHGLSAHKLPSKPDALRKLALRAGYKDDSEKTAEGLLAGDFQRHTRTAREIFFKVVR